MILRISKDGAVFADQRAVHIDALTGELEAFQKSNADQQAKQPQ